MKKIKKKIILNLIPMIICIFLLMFYKIQTDPGSEHDIASGMDAAATQEAVSQEAYSLEDSPGDIPQDVTGEVVAAMSNEVVQDVSEESMAVPPVDETAVVVPDVHISLSVIGDVMCHMPQANDAYDASLGTYDFSYVFDNIREDIAAADLAIGNLETTFAGKAKGYSGYPKFNSPEQMAGNLRDLGIDVLTTANNHCMDKGYDGVESTLNYLDEAGIVHTGTSRSAEEQNTILIRDVNGIRIAILSYTYGTNGIAIPSDKAYAVNLIDEGFIQAQLDLAKAQNPDLICVSMHWGVEYQTTQNATQERLADFLFTNGVDMILGSHPHVLQPMEKRVVTMADGTQKECFVIYSLGNFISNQSKPNTQTSIILKLGIHKDADRTSVDSVSYIPIYMCRTAPGEHKYSVLNIEQSIARYESGEDVSIGEGVYSELKKELERVRNLMGTEWQ